MKKLIYIVLIAFLVSGCAKKAAGNVSTENDAIQLEYLT